MRAPVNTRQCRAVQFGHLLYQRKTLQRIGKQRRGDFTGQVYCLQTCPVHTTDDHGLLQLRIVQCIHRQAQAAHALAVGPVLRCLVFRAPGAFAVVFQ
ncbi:hypothetical protein D3C81_977290 [compost metagenome]